MNNLFSRFFDSHNEVECNEGEVDFTLSIDQWNGMDQISGAVVQLESSTVLRLLQLAHNESLSVDALLLDMVEAYLGAKFIGQVQTDSKRDVPRLES